MSFFYIIARFLLNNHFWLSQNFIGGLVVVVVVVVVVVAFMVVTYDSTTWCNSNRIKSTLTCLRSSNKLISTLKRIYNSNEIISTLVCLDSSNKMCRASRSNRVKWKPPSFFFFFTLKFCNTPRHTSDKRLTFDFCKILMAKDIYKYF